MFKKLVGIWVIVLILGAISLAKPQTSPMQPQPVTTTAPMQKFYDALRAVPVPDTSPPAIESCSVAVFGFKGCKELEQLNVDIENTRPCMEMRKRGMQAQADRCFKETRELDRDARDRIRFQRGQ
jgi:hypothetical protein